MWWQPTDDLTRLPLSQAAKDAAGPRRSGKEVLGVHERQLRPLGLHCVGGRHLSRAFTLLELLLVMALFAAVAAVTMPAAGMLLADRRLDRAADHLQAEMTGLRARAVREGYVLAMRTGIGDTQLLVEPILHAGDATQSRDTTGLPSALLTGADQAMPSGAESAASERVGGIVGRRVIELPEAVTVVSVSTSPVGGSSTIEQASMLAPFNPATGLLADDQTPGEANGQPLSGAIPQSTVYFYPHGQTSNAAILLTHPEIGYALITLRGLTGEVQWEALSPQQVNR